MAWGLQSPSGHGIFYPKGSYHGWAKDLDRYYASIEGAEESEVISKELERLSISYPLFVAEKFSYRDAEPVKSFEFPTKFLLDQSIKSLPSMIETETRILAVDDELRRTIEEFEPGIHQFSPVSIVGKNGVVYPGSYFCFVIRNFRSSFLPEVSDYYDYSEGMERYDFLDQTKKTFSKIKLSRDEINGAHIWRERKTWKPEIFISDELQAEISRRDLQIFKHYPVVEI